MSEGWKRAQVSSQSMAITDSKHEHLSPHSFPFFLSLWDFKVENEDQSRAEATPASADQHAFSMPIIKYAGPQRHQRELPGLKEMDICLLLRPPEKSHSFCPSPHLLYSSTFFFHLLLCAPSMCSSPCPSMLHCASVFHVYLHVPFYIFPYILYVTSYCFLCAPPPSSPP